MLERIYYVNETFGESMVCIDKAVYLDSLKDFKEELIRNEDEDLPKIEEIISKVESGEDYNEYVCGYDMWSKKLDVKPLRELPEGDMRTTMEEEGYFDDDSEDKDDYYYFYDEEGKFTLLTNLGFGWYEIDIIYNNYEKAVE